LFPAFVARWYPPYIAANELVIWVYVGTAALTIGYFEILFRAVGNGRPLVAIQALVVFVATAACVFATWMNYPLVAFAVIFAAARLVAAAAGWTLGRAAMLRVRNV
jgi:hypothetical protein